MGRLEFVYRNVFLIVDCGRLYTRPLVSAEDPRLEGFIGLEKFVNN